MSIDGLCLGKNPKNCTMNIEDTSELVYRYNMTNKRRGRAVIFNHKTFDDLDLKTREGTNQDRDSLQKTLTIMGFDVEVIEDERVANIKKTVEELSKEDHRDADCVLVAVLTHGKKDRLYDSEGTDYSQDDLWRPFLKDTGNSLVGKPKIFLIQACRGGKIDEGRPVSLGRGANMDATPILPDEQDEEAIKIPNYADFLILRSTPLGYVSWRRGTGSWFIQAFSDVLDSTLGKGDFSKDLVTLMTRVSNKVSQENSIPDELKQIPEISSTLTKQIYFN